MKHSQESRGAGGLLLGIDLDGVVEISNSFPMPSVSHAQETEDDKAARSAARYQASMLRSLKDIQRDDNVVGMYQSSSLGAYLSASLIESLVAQHDKLRHGGNSCCARYTIFLSECLHPIIILNRCVAHASEQCVLPSV